MQCARPETELFKDARSERVDQEVCIFEEVEEEAQRRRCFEVEGYAGLVLREQVARDSTWTVDTEDGGTVGSEKLATEGT